jgi:hypothetical protein
MKKALDESATNVTLEAMVWEELDQEEIEMMRGGLADITTGPILSNNKDNLNNTTVSAPICLNLSSLLK